MLETLLRTRDRLLADGAFHRRLQRIPLFRSIARRRARQLFDIAVGFSYTQVLTSCVELDLFEHLADGPLATDELARRVNLPVDALRCLLGAAAELDLVSPTRDLHWRLGELGAASRGNPGIAAMVRHNQLLYRDFLHPLERLRDRSETELNNFWTYAAREPVPGAGNATAYSQLMAQSQTFVADDVLAHAPLTGARHLIDIGGGSGFFAAEALRRYPALRATVFDLPDVTPLATQRFATEGLADRGSVHSGDMFNDTLPGEPDAISLVRVLHDHDDPQVRRVLKAARRALGDDGTLLIAEPMAQTRGVPGVGVYFHLYLWAMQSGRPRSREELTLMLNEAGFGQVREVTTYQPLLVRMLVARP